MRLRQLVVTFNAVAFLFPRRWDWVLEVSLWGRGVFVPWRLVNFNTKDLDREGGEYCFFLG